jgi:hypothetical protein
MKKNIHKQMVAAARPTIKKTPVTAPVLWKNLLHMNISTTMHSAVKKGLLGGTA